MSVMDGVQSAFQRNALSRVTRQHRVERNSFCRGGCALSKFPLERAFWETQIRCFAEML